MNFSPGCCGFNDTSSLMLNYLWTVDNEHYSKRINHNCTNTENKEFANPYTTKFILNEKRACKWLSDSTVSQISLLQAHLAHNSNMVAWMPHIFVTRRSHRFTPPRCIHPISCAFFLLFSFVFFFFLSSKVN